MELTFNEMMSAPPLWSPHRGLDFPNITKGVSIQFFLLRNGVRQLLLALVALAPCIFSSVCAQDSVLATSPYHKWPHGPSPEASFFPIAVWLQNPSNAERYRAAGFNTYVGLWQGPTEQQLTALSKAGMRLICEQNEVALRHLDDRTIIGWMHGDEPDNAQE